MAHEARALDHAACRHTIADSRVWATTTPIKINLHMLRAKDNLNRRAIGKTRRQELPKGGVGQRPVHTARYDIHIREKRRRRFVHGGVVNIIGRALLHDMTVAHQGDLIGHAHRFFGLMGDKNHRCALFFQQFQCFIADAIAQAIVQPRKGFIHQHHFGARRKRAGQGHTLLLAARQHMDAFFPIAFEIDTGEQFLNPRAHFRAAPL